MVLCPGKVAIWIQILSVNFLCYFAEDVSEWYDVVPLFVAGDVAYKIVFDVEAVSEAYVVVLVELTMMGNDIVAFWIGLVFCDFI